MKLFSWFFKNNKRTEIINNIKSRGGTTCVLVPKEEYEFLKKEYETYKNLSHREAELIDWLKEHKIFKDLSSFIKEPNAFNRLVSGLLGWTWENSFLDKCEKMGFLVKKASKLNSRFDCSVNGLTVQCKHTSSSDLNVDIRNRDSNNNRRYQIEDFDLLAIRHPTGEFIIPTTVLPLTDGLLLPSSINVSKYQEFKDNYDIIKNEFST